MRRRSRTPGWIYVIGAAEVGRVKIGFTYRQTPEQRLCSLRTASPVALTLLRSFPGDQRLERGLHHYFAGERVIGEWFADSVVPEIDDAIEDVEAWYAAVGEA